MAKKTPKIAVGQPVLFVPREISRASNFATVLPAVIVRTWEETPDPTQVNLKVLNDGKEDLWETSVSYSETKEPRTWHWSS